MKKVGTDLGALDIEVAADGRANVGECGPVNMLETDLLLALRVAADHRDTTKWAHLQIQTFSLRKLHTENFESMLN